MGHLCRLRCRLLLSTVSTAGVMLWLSGCGSGASVPSDQPPPPPVSTYPGSGFGGTAFAGDKPLAGAAVQLYAAGTTGNGSPATALLGSPLTTDASGAFRVLPAYPCPSGSSQVYVVVSGGSTSAISVPSNIAAAMLAVLGPCNQIATSSSFVVNEVTTVAAVYALSAFMAVGAGTKIGASPTNSTGFANAIATAQALANVNTGATPGPSFAANGSSPALRIDSIANLLNGCTKASPGDSGCSELFMATALAGSPPPANTIDALLNLTRNPAANVAALFSLAAANPAFAPALTTAPSDWTIFIKYTGGGMNQPTSLGLDSMGDIWVASYFGAASLFSPLGKPLLSEGVTGFGLSDSYGLAVDANDDAWVANEPGPLAVGDSVSILTPAGQSGAVSAGFTSGGLDYPVSIAIDTDTTAWIVDYGNSHLTHLSDAGQPLSGTGGFTSPLLAFPVAAAVDKNHNLWVANQAGTAVTKVTADGSQFTNYDCCDAASALAIDQSGNVWVANYYGNSVSELSSSGTVLANGTLTGGGMDHPQAIAIDGGGDVWVANYRGPSLTKLAGANSASGSPSGAILSPPYGWGSDAALSEAYSLAVDASGNIWVSNSGSNTLTQFVGLAVPVATPLLGPPVAP